MQNETTKDEESPTPINVVNSNPSYLGCHFFLSHIVLAKKKNVKITVLRRTQI